MNQQKKILIGPVPLTMHLFKFEINRIANIANCIATLIFSPEWNFQKLSPTLLGVTNQTILPKLYYNESHIKKTYRADNYSTLHVQGVLFKDCQTEIRQQNWNFELFLGKPKCVEDFFVPQIGLTVGVKNGLFLW